jgi:DNA-binding FadR family transcriptional regulator
VVVSRARSTAEEPSVDEGEGRGNARRMRPLHLPKAAELVAAEIRRQIVRGELKEGDSLPSEAKLMEQFEISRPTLREALRVLESELLISVHRGARGGARVRTPDTSVAARYAGLVLQINGGSLDDILATQLVLETGAIRRLATQKDKSAGIALLRATLEEEERALDDLERFSSCAVRFHEALIDATDSPSLGLLGGMLKEIVERHVSLVAARQPRLPAAKASWRTKSHEVHASVVELIAGGRADEAEDLWRRHDKASRRAMASQLAVKEVLELFD